MFYTKLSRAQIPKAQKDTGDLTVIFALLGSFLGKVANKMLVKSTPGCQFHQHFTRSFSAKRFMLIFLEYSVELVAYKLGIPSSFV